MLYKLQSLYFKHFRIDFYLLEIINIILCLNCFYFSVKSLETIKTMLIKVFNFQLIFRCILKLVFQIKFTQINVYIFLSLS